MRTSGAPIFQRSVVVVGFLVTSLLPIQSADRSLTTYQTAQAQNGVDNKVIFISGIGTHSDCNTSSQDSGQYTKDWRTLINGLRSWRGIDAIDIAGTPYKTNSYCSPLDATTPGDSSFGLIPRYFDIDTCRAIAETTARLDYLLRTRFSQSDYPNAKFTIIGHSLGGVIASYWAAQTNAADQQLLSRINAVVTLDSPLLGAHAGVVLPLRWNCLGLEPVFSDLESSSPVINSVKQSPKWIMDRGGKFVVIYNENDLSSFKIDGDKWLEFLTKPDIREIQCGTAIALTPDEFANNHGCVLHNSQALQIIRDIIPNPPGSACTPGQNGVVLYEDINYQGRCVTVTGNQADFRNVGFNDVASSARFVGSYASRLEVQLYQDINYGGSSIALHGDHPDLRGLGFNDATSSIRIREASQAGSCANPAFTLSPSVIPAGSLYALMAVGFEPYASVRFEGISAPPGGTFDPPGGATLQTDGACWISATGSTRVLDPPGVWTLQASGPRYGGGTLVLTTTITINNDPDGLVLTSSQVILATLSPIGDQDSYHFDATQGQQLNLDVRVDSGGYFTPEIELFDPSGRKLSLGSCCNVEHFVLPMSGRYRVTVLSRTGTTGLYVLHINFVWPPAAPNGLRATAISSTRVRLVWNDNSTDEDGFEIWDNEALSEGPHATTPRNTTAHTLDLSSWAWTNRSTWCFYIRAFRGSIWDYSYFSSDSPSTCVNLGGATTETPVGVTPTRSPTVTPTHTTSSTLTPIHIPTSTPTTAVGIASSYLSDLAWVEMANDFGPVEKDQSRDHHPITLNGRLYPKGLGVHAFSDVRYYMNGGCSSFMSDIGLDDESDGWPGSVTFQVWLDGIPVYDSGVMRDTTQTRSVNLSVASQNELRLVVTDAGDGRNSDHGDWADARLVCNPILSPTASATPVGLGTWWEETESGWPGTVAWIRRDGTNIFDGRWTGAGQVTAVLTIQLNGTQVIAQRRQSSDGNDCDYMGTLSTDGRHVSGSYVCFQGQGYQGTWQATIRTDSPPGSTPTVSPSITSVTCPLHSYGDANCDGRIDLVDYDIWEDEFTGQRTTTSSDFNGDGVVTLIDFNIWRTYYSQTVSPTPSASVTNTPTWTPSRTPTKTLTPTRTAIPTVTFTRSPTSTATPTLTVPQGIGGRGFTLDSSRRMHWTGGNVQASYYVLRYGANSGLLFLSTLPGNAISYVDTSAVQDSANCYVILAFNTNPPRLESFIGMSDMECVFPNTGNGTQPRDFAIRLDQGSAATLTWDGPGVQTAYQLVARKFDGTSPVVTQLLANTTSVALATGGQSTCYVLRAMFGSQVIGITDELCAVPGISVLPGPSLPISATVEMVDFWFQPQTVNIALGGSVTWVNRGQVPHTASGIGREFDTLTLNPIQSRTIVFSSAGVFDYRCDIHPSMTGRIVVGDFSPAADLGGWAHGVERGLRDFDRTEELVQRLSSSITTTSSNSIPAAGPTATPTMTSTATRIISPTPTGTPIQPVTTTATALASGPPTR